MATMPLLHSCRGGAEFHTTGSESLGVLLARAAGRPPEVLAETLFEPLGMVDTWGSYRLTSGIASPPCTAGPGAPGGRGDRRV
ncbi:MAG: hypothetical protein R2761_23275 [Acidimicrobiales bacterium]